MAGRGSSGLSFVVGIDKPIGLSSHDVVNRCRGIFGERRVGHTGTLDPLASGVLMVCVGPATRLDAYLVGCEKEYRSRVVFGSATSTDDAEGEVLRTAEVPDCVFDIEFASTYLEGLVGLHRQLPPAYSAIKIGGAKACDAARRGHIIEMKPRDIDISKCELSGMGIDDDGAPYWDVCFAVSSGTYIRALARDIGNELGTAAHLGALRRTRIGRACLEDCVSLDALLLDPGLGRLDPVDLLGLRIVYLDDRSAMDVSNGKRLDPASCSFFAASSHGSDGGCGGCGCMPTVVPSAALPADGEMFSLIAENKLVALYGYDKKRGVLESRCGFSRGVSRGIDHLG